MDKHLGELHFLQNAAYLIDVKDCDLHFASSSLVLRV